MLPDLETLRVCSWLESTAMVLCDVAARDDDGLLPLAPRSVLKNMVTTLPKVATPLREHRSLSSFCMTIPSAGHEQRYVGLSHAGNYIEDYHTLQDTARRTVCWRLRRHLSKSGVPSKTPKASGVLDSTS